MDTKEIYIKWLNMPIPTESEKYRLSRHLKTNLWLLKDQNSNFGFLITDTYSTLMDEYRNISSNTVISMKDSGGQIIRNCLLIVSKPSIDSDLFCNAISSLFDTRAEDRIFGIEDIEGALIKIEEITTKETEEFNSVVGAWGELNLLNKLINPVTPEASIYEIINSWEGVKDRTIIDFNIMSKKTKLEVKTTSKTNRLHHINGLNQVTCLPDWAGFIASTCIYEDPGGLSCQALVNILKSKINENAINLLNKKIGLRGKVCNNNSLKFTESKDKCLEFYKFIDVPKPSIEPGVGKIEWEAILDAKPYLDSIKKSLLLNLMN